MERWYLQLLGWSLGERWTLPPAVELVYTTALQHIKHPNSYPTPQRRRRPDTPRCYNTNSYPGADDTAALRSEQGRSASGGGGNVAGGPQRP